MSPSAPPAFPVFDSHVDSLQRSLDLGHDLGTKTPGQLDLVRGRAGGLRAVVFVSWVDPLYMEQGRARRRAADLVAEFHGLIAEHPERVAWVGDGAALDAARARDLIAGIPGIEGGHAIEESLENLEWFFERGVRVLTLVWNNHLSWIRSCQDGADGSIPAGLSEFGRDVVRRMNELGMLVDVSHAGERSFYDVLETSERPVIASHSGCRTVNEHQRNLSDAQLRALSDAGGVVGLVFCTPFLDRAAQSAENELRASEAYRAIDGINETAKFLAQAEFLQRTLPPLPIARVVDHIEHAVRVAGIDHVGLGSDFDGIQRRPAGLEDASGYGALAVALRERGFASDAIAKIFSENMERVFRQATGSGTRAASEPLTELSVSADSAT